MRAATVVSLLTFFVISAYAERPRTQGMGMMRSDPSRDRNGPPSRPSQAFAPPRNWTPFISNCTTDNSTVATVDNSTVTTVDNSTVTTVDNSTVTTVDNSTVTTVDNSTVTTVDNSTVTTVDNSTVTTVDNSTVATVDNSTVTSVENTTVADNSTVASSDNSTTTSSSNSTSDSTSFVQDLLSAHNVYRTLHGVANLTLNSTLNAYALEWAEYLANNTLLQHRTDPIYGENIYWSSAETTAQAAADAWYSEISDYTDYTNEPNMTSFASGHFTQMVWKNSEQLGCGSVTASSGAFYVVCNYSPAGNYIGEFVENVLEPSS